MLAFAILACLLTAMPFRAQKTSDPCGDPFVESMAWVRLDGHVSKVIDGRTVQVAVPDSAWANRLNRGGARTIRVRIAGIALDQRKQFSKRAKERV